MDFRVWLRPSAHAFARLFLSLDDFSVHRRKMNAKQSASQPKI